MKFLFDIPIVFNVQKTILKTQALKNQLNKSYRGLNMPILASKRGSVCARPKGVKLIPVT